MNIVNHSANGLQSNYYAESLIMAILSIFNSDFMM